MNIQEKMNAYKQGFIDGKKELQQENTKLKSDLQALRERLRCIEWVYDEEGDKCFCPACEGTSTFVGFNPESTGHYEGCWLKAELDKIKGVE